MLKTCKKHGNVKHFLRTDGYLRCSKCASDAVARRRRRVKKKLVEHFGGKCIKCGYNKSQKALVFHHRDSEKKEFLLSQASLHKKWKVLLAEASKCDLLCANCHHELK